MQSPNAYRGANHRIVKQRNRATIFQAIRALSPIARAQLARRTGLNAATVTKIVDELIAAELVAETGYGTARIGRKPIHLQVNPSARFTLGIDITRSSITGAIVDLSGTIVECIKEAAGPWPTNDAFLAMLTGMIERLLARLAPRGHASVIGIGIGAPGSLSFHSGRFLTPPSYGTWDDLAVRTTIEGRFNLPTRIDNNGNTSALAELWFGAGQRMDNFVLLNISTGVRAALVLDGDLYRGEHDFAGNLGHIPINAHGPRCVCGNYGCLETHVAVPRVLGAVRAALAIGEPSAVRTMMRDEDDLTLDTLLAAARIGDALALRVMDDVARALTVGIVTIVHALDPQMILIGREMAKAGDLLLDPVRDAVRQRISPALRDVVRIEVSTLADGPVIGAATLALREFFHAPLTHSNALTA